MRRIKRWFIEPLDPDTNERLAKELELHIDVGDRTSYRQSVAGEPLKVWECSEDERKRLEDACTQAHLRFRAWWTFEEEPLRKWPLDTKKRAQVTEVRRLCQAIKASRVVS